MSVGLYKYDGDIYDENSEIVLSENIASQAFYERCWRKAILQFKIKYIQDGAEFDCSKKDQAMRELDLLHGWAECNLRDEELEYMKSRVENLQKVIPAIFLDDEKAMLYIF